MNAVRKKLLLRLLIYAAILVTGMIYLLLCLNGMGAGCFFYEHFHLTCISCGAIRALMAILRLDFRTAVSCHPVFTLAVYPIGALIALQDIAVTAWNLLTGKDRLSFLQYLFSRQSPSVWDTASRKKERTES